jgi:GTP-binding protein
MPFTVAIIGRPNVGKSTLFNRLVGRRLALVDDKPGVTRDRRAGAARLGDLEFRVIDTAGLDEASDDSLEARMSEQTMRAAKEADAVLFLIDARAGVTPIDRHFAQLLRRVGGKVILVANKSEGRAGTAGAYDAFALGLGEPVPLSAEHGEGMADLYAALAPLASPTAPASDAAEDTAPESDKPLKIAICGRPNVGKSTLANKLIGEERLLTGPEAGITRDAITVDWEWQGRKIGLVDTAGLRRRPRVEEKLEKLSVADTLRAIRFAETVIVVLDATQGIEKQDLTIIRMIEEEGRAVVLAANKWDLVGGAREAQTRLTDRLQTSLTQLQGISLVPVSAKTGKGLDRLMKAVIEADDAWNRRIATPMLNRWLAAVQETHPPPLVEGKRLRLRYMTQANIRPPTFALFASKPGELPQTYRRYLVNRMREDFALPGVPIRMMLRKGENPYAGKN